MNGLILRLKGRPLTWFGIGLEVGKYVVLNQI